MYNAIMKAADFIETHPDEFDYDAISKPHPCKTPGCAFGWIGYFAGLSKKCAISSYTLQVVAKALGFNYEEHCMHDGHPFYARLEDLSPGWKDGAAVCAKALRLYAAKYHAPVKTGLPDIVRNIFQPAQVVA